MKKCKQGYYYCYKDKRCKRIPLGYRVGLGGWLRKEKEEEKDETAENGNHKNGNGSGNGGSDGGSNGGGVSEGWSAKYKKSIDCNNPKGFSQKAHCQGRKKMNVKEEGLRDWFGKSKSKDGKSGWVDVVDGDACAREKGETATPKCVSSAKRASMSKKERLAAQAAKRREDPGQPQKSGAAKPTMVKTDRKTRKEEMEVTEAKDKKGKGSGTKDACYHKVKSRYSVWPSAYASGALVKCRKVGAANWGNKSESYEFSNWRDDFKATEYEFIDIIEAEPIKGGQPIEEGQKCWKGYEKKGTKKMFGKTYNNCVKKEEVESKIGGGNLKKLSTKAAKRVDADVDGDVDSQDPKASEMGEFIPSPDGKKKVKTKARFEQFFDWRSELGEGVMPAAIDPKAHRKQQRAAKVRNLAQKGATEGERAAAERKTKGPKMFGEDWQKVNKSDKTDGMSAAAVKAYRRENPGSKLKTAVTGDPKPGSKDAKRRKSFCARSKGQQDMHNIDCSKTPDKPVCKARRRWKC